MVVTKTEAEANEAKGELESGKSFAVVARARSLEPVSKANGARLDDVTIGKSEQSLEDTIFGAKASVLRGPVHTPFGYYIFEVTKITRGGQEPLAAVASKIERHLLFTRRNMAMATFMLQFRKRWRSQTVCRDGYVMSDCDEYRRPATKASTS